MAASSAGSTDPRWEEYKKLICKIYELYGGDCDDLEWPDEGDTEVSLLRSEFDANGLPVFSSPQEEQEFRELLDDLEQCIGLAGAPPSATAKAATQSLIDAMRAALPT